MRWPSVRRIVLAVPLLAACSVDPSVVMPQSDDIDTLPDASADTSRGDAGSTEAGGDAAPHDAGTPDSAVSDGGCAAPCGVHSVCVGGSCSAARRVFVSTTSSEADLGGHSGADNQCATLASAQTLGGTWMAWVSDSTSSPSDRFTQSSDSYRLLDGTLVAHDWSELTSGALSHAIDVNEIGATVDNAPVWTATATNGMAMGGSCSDFSSTSSSDGVAEVGLSTASDTTWTDNAADPCNDAHPHIYCFEQ
jgi:hypothetical protein